jgi:hypothetical protein
VVKRKDKIMSEVCYDMCAKEEPKGVVTFACTCGHGFFEVTAEDGNIYFMCGSCGKKYDSAVVDTTTEEQYWTTIEEENA